MKTEEMICELRRLEEAHKDDFVGTCETNWSLMCHDVANRLEELLTAQEPRLMTLEEVLATEVVYAEDIDKAEIIPVLVSRQAHDRIVLVRAHLMGGPSHVIYPLICEYGKRWRCWTSCPTDEQREATPWRSRWNGYAPARRC